MKVAILASGWAGFNDAAARHLADRGVELLVVTPLDVADTDYSSHHLASYAQVHAVGEVADRQAITDAVLGFEPDAVLVHSWHHRHYRRVLRRVPGTTVRVLWMDNVWRNVPKQWLGRAVAPWWVRPLFECALVPSDRTEFFARRLGFDEDDVIRGGLSADTELFGSRPRSGSELVGSGRFVAALRLVHHKGADVLADAYRLYREQVDEPWDLEVAGVGPLARHLDGIDGVHQHGFLQPRQLADLMRRSSCMVVPSRVEPYGVVVHEAAVNALPILTTYRVGAAPMFVQDGQNGWVVPSDDIASLATAMVKMSTSTPARLEQMSRLSHHLGQRLSSDLWAAHLHEELQSRSIRAR